MESQVEWKKWRDIRTELADEWRALFDHWPNVDALVTCPGCKQTYRCGDAVAEKGGNGMLYCPGRTTGECNATVPEMSISISDALALIAEKLFLKNLKT
jgi:hypothetical protein